MPRLTARSSTLEARLHHPLNTVQHHHPSHPLGSHRTSRSEVYVKAAETLQLVKISPEEGILTGIAASSCS